MAAGQLVERVDRGGVPSQAQLGVQARLERVEALLLEQRDLQVREWLGGHLGQRRPAPEPQRADQQLAGAGGLAALKRAAPGAQAFAEDLRVELAGADLEPVAGGHRAQLRAVGTERRAQAGDRDLHALGGATRRRSGPQLLDQAVGRDGLVAVQEQEGEQRELAPSAERPLRAAPAELDGSEDPEAHGLHSYTLSRGSRAVARPLPIGCRGVGGPTHPGLRWGSVQQAAAIAPRRGRARTARARRPPRPANAPLRRLQIGWTLTIVASWSHLVAIGVVAYDAGGARAVGLAALARTLPAAGGVALTSAVAARLTRRAALVAVVGLATMVFRQAHAGLLPRVVGPRARLRTANAVTTTLEAAAVMLGPALGSAAVALGSVTGALVVAAVLATIGAAVVATVVPHATPARLEGRGGRALRDLRAAAAQPSVRLILGLLLAQTLVSGALSVPIVVCAIDLLDLGRAGVGTLTAAYGLGGLLGGALAVGGGRGARLGRLLWLGLVLWGAPLVLLGLVPHPEPALALALLAAVGVGNTLFDVASVTFLHWTITPQRLAHVFGLLEVVVVIGLGAGSILVAGVVAELGVRATLVATGALLPVLALCTAGAVRRLAAACDAPPRPGARAAAVPVPGQSWA